ncbi:MAG TPA: FHA domain-containing protein, partial [Minicystis sp.]|nr:FHA domain-containing protein [Minicystis sp.]
MGFFDRFAKPPREARAGKKARERELDGDLASAAELFEDAGLHDDAARVLLLRADAEPSPEKRIAFCALAAERAENAELVQKALRRKALLAFDVLRARGGAVMKNEVLAVARDLETTGELERAADAYALAGDADSEVRALTAAGAIERLEERLRVADAAAREQRDLDLVLRKLEDLDRTAERRAALALARDALAKRDDERVADVARRIRARVARGPVVDFEIDGAHRKVALGAEIVLGRGDATIVLASRAV